MKQQPLVFVLLLALLACTGKKDEPISDDTYIALPAEPDSVETNPQDTLHLFDEIEIPKAADELFDDFFFSFASDAKFQSQRIKFPLHGNEDGEAVTLTKDQWGQADKFGNLSFFSVLYERESDIEIQKDTSLNQVSVDQVRLADGLVDRYNFKRLDGMWLLTDFEQLNVTKMPNADFLQFYAKFVTDTVFQRESIGQPLRLVSPSADEDMDEGGEIQLTSDDWFEFRKEMPMPEQVMTNINYGQAALGENRKVLLVEGMSTGLFVKYTFTRQNGQWMLVEIEN